MLKLWCRMGWQALYKFILRLRSVIKYKFKKVARLGQLKMEMIPSRKRQKSLIPSHLINQIPQFGISFCSLSIGLTIFGTS